MNSNSRRTGNRRRLSGAAALTLTAGLVLSGCGSAGEPAQNAAETGETEPQPGGDLTVLLDAGFSGGWNTGLDPATSNSVGANLGQNSAIFGGLFTLDADQAPAVAVS